MKEHRRHAILAGVFYITAAVTSIIAVILYEPILSGDWLTAVMDGYRAQLLAGVANDILLIMSMIGTAVMLFPYLRRQHESAALGYFSFRLMESVAIMIGLVAILGLMNISSAAAAESIQKSEGVLAAGTALQAFHSWTFMIGPNLMLGPNTLLYSLVFLASGLVPRKLAWFGIVTAILVCAAGWLEMFGVIDPLSTAKGLLGLPIAGYEMTLAGWLIAKGFDVQALKRLGFTS